tara:strand:+ start:1460 stop:2086 length:627 start_codon:yes stop_codon:yes gene_type:complete
MADEEEQAENDGDGAGAAAEGGEGLDEEPKKGGLKKVLLILVPLLLLGGGGGGAYYMGYLDSLLGIEAEEHAEGEDGHGEEGGDDHAEAKDSHGSSGGGDHGSGGGSSAFIAVPTMIVNLAGPEEETPRYLRLTVQLELSDPSESEAIQVVIPRVVDQFQTFLRELRVRDLRGSAGIYRLQMELLSRVNQAAYPIEVKDILFQEILIQ